MSLLRVALEDAVREDKLSDNPARGVVVRRVERTDEPWTFLTLDEQRAIATVIPEPERSIYEFALGTGLRQGEQWHLRRADVHVGQDPHVVVRFGSAGKPPKNGKIRRVPLFGVGLDAAKAWLAALDTYAPHNPRGLMFPTRRGAARGQSKAPKAWFAALEAGRITRRVRWHDLRHSCASALVSGMWGRVWSLHEVKELLGHSSTVVTERYAHLAGTALKAAAEATQREWPRNGRTPYNRRNDARITARILALRNQLSDVRIVLGALKLAGFQGVALAALLRFRPLSACVSSASSAPARQRFERLTTQIRRATRDAPPASV